MTKLRNSLGVNDRTIIVNMLHFNQKVFGRYENPHPPPPHMRANVYMYMNLRKIGVCRIIPIYPVYII